MYYGSSICPLLIFISSGSMSIIMLFLIFNILLYFRRDLLLWLACKPSNGLYLMYLCKPLIIVRFSVFSQQGTNVFQFFDIMMVTLISGKSLLTLFNGLIFPLFILDCLSLKLISLLLLPIIG